MKVPAPHCLEPHPATLSQDLATLPASPGIYSVLTSGNEPHLSWSINLKRRLNRLLLPSYTASPGKLTSLAQKVAQVHYWPVSSRLESALILYELTRSFHPDTYLLRLHLRMPWFIGLTDQDGFARLAVANKLGGQAAGKYGPFRTREAALLYEEQVSSLYQIRRCAEPLHPAPGHPGCIYGEMNQCLRPCQLAVSAEEYASEASRVSDFLGSGGKSALQTLAAARDRAAAELDFEQAALAHKRIEKVQAAKAVRDEVVGAAESFHGVAVTRAAEADGVNLWPMTAGIWQTPIHLHLPVHQEQSSRSLDALLRESLQDVMTAPDTSGNRLEQLALFARWYYSSWRDGEWFAFQTLPQLNYRRLVKTMSDLVKAPPENPKRASVS